MSSVMTYEGALAFLKAGRDKKQRPLENNTRLIRRDHCVAIQLHETDVVQIFPGDIYRLDSGGWRTVTTKDRISKYSPTRPYSKNGIWYVNEALFEDGIRVNAKGSLVGGVSKKQLAKGEQLAKRKLQLDKLVRAYVRGFCEMVKKERKLPDVSLGDCFACQGMPLGNYHLLEHLKEKYYMGSLIWNAIKSQGYNQPEFIGSLMAGDAQHGRTTMLSRILSGYFRRLKPELLGVGRSMPRRENF
jgi:hypothetical protein